MTLTLIGLNVIVDLINVRQIFSFLSFLLICNDCQFFVYYFIMVSLSKRKCPDGQKNSTKDYFPSVLPNSEMLTLYDLKILIM